MNLNLCQMGKGKILQTHQRGSFRQDLALPLIPSWHLASSWHKLGFSLPICRALVREKCGRFLHLSSCCRERHCWSVRAVFPPCPDGNLSQCWAPRNHARDVLGLPESLIPKIPSSANVLLNSMKNRLLHVEAFWSLHFPLTVLLPPPQASFQLPTATLNVLTVRHLSQDTCPWRSPVTWSPPSWEQSSL